MSLWGDNAGDGGGTSDDRAQQADDDIPEDHYYVWVAIPTQSESSFEYGKERRLKNRCGCELFIRFISA